MNSIYSILNNSWKTTIKVLFGDEAGELSSYDEWLSHYSYGSGEAHSYLSGKEVILSSSNYSKNSKFISYDEINFNKKFEPLNINEIKDIDSIVEALKERFIYAGNVVLGKSGFVEKSTGIFNSYYILKSSLAVQPNQYVYLSRQVRNCNNVFGSYFVGELNYSVRAFNSAFSSRLFETYLTVYSSDIYFSYDIKGSNSVMFSFSIRSKNFVIGNLQLEKDKYLRVSSSLKEQLLDELKKNKQLPSLYSLASSKPEALSFDYQAKKLSLNEDRITNSLNEIFNTTTKLLFKKELGNFRDYADYFISSLPVRFKEVSSALSGRKIILFTDNHLKDIPETRIVSNDEALFLSTKLKLNERDIESFDSIKSSIGKIAFFSGEFIHDCSEVAKTSFCHGSSLLYKVAHGYHMKRCAYSYWPRSSESAFGCSFNFISTFCINCHYSERLTRAFEVDLSNSSSDLYFSHNVENIRQGMFNFNVKNLTYAIGNASYNPETYMRIKNSLVEQIADELEKTKKLKWNIYNIGSIKS